jgi:hypothetical protein
MRRRRIEALPNPSAIRRLAPVFHLSRFRRRLFHRATDSTGVVQGANLA